MDDATDARTKSVLDVFLGIFPSGRSSGAIGRGIPQSADLSRSRRELAREPRAER